MINKELQIKPLISVVIPCRNEAEFIEKTIDSLLAQENLPGGLEILVVDGMSQDGTKEILEKFREKDNRVKIIVNEKKTTPYAMNLGINKAQGDFIAIMGAHSEYDTNYLSASLELFEKDPNIIGTGGPIRSTGRTEFGKASALAMSIPIGVGNAKHRFHNFEGFAEGAAFPLFKKEAFKLAGMYDESLDRNQDDELNYRLNELGYKIYISPIARSTYYVRDSPKELFKQYFNYGYWRMAVIRKHKIPVSFRQMVPPVFFLMVLLFIIFSVLLPYIPFFCAFILPVIYILAISTSAITIIKKNGIRIGLLFPIAVVTLHFAYAAGFLKGLRFLFNKL